MYHSYQYKAILRTLTDQLNLSREEGIEAKITQAQAILNFYSDPAMRVLCKFVMRRLDKIRDLMGVIARASQFDDVRPTHIMEGMQNGNLMVYKNIKVHRTTPDTSWSVNNLYRYLQPTWDMIQEERKDEKKAKAWETPRRTLKRLFRKEETRTGVALRECTTIVAFMKCRYNTDQIEQHLTRTTTRLQESIRPLTLEFAETPEAILDMYEGGLTSCMVSAGKEVSWQWMIDDHHIGPSAFYIYTGKAKGAFIKRNGSVVARCIIYQQRDDSWQYGRIYFATQEWATRFQTILHTNNIQRLSDSGRCWNHSFKWEAPAFHNTKDQLWYTPVPYFDNFESGKLNAVFHPAKEGKDAHFEFHVNGSKGNVATGLTIGLISQIGTLECSQCKRRLQDVQPIFAMDGTGQYCGQTCANAQDYHGCTRSDGVVVWLHKSAAFITVDNKFFTNVASAKARGAVPVLTEPDMLPEDEDFLGTNRAAQIAGTHYSTVEKPALPLLNWLKLKPKGFSKMDMISTKVQRNVDPDVLSLIETNRLFDFPEEIVQEFFNKVTSEFDFHPASMQVILSGGLNTSGRYINTTHSTGMEL